ncbi:cbb3-type cytochrome oxidase subunit 3 [Stenoxybacter acetivorans]|uniref:cbb3-type cytochrome oxidase subunit 3 n=1 Tax=Stenoxybacter acetivorans TaxID=422441 RepID=UPI000A0284C2|nr:cbb3-type cytochrome c oxidase subunit 3 [Stenoxybacter acetivorans]
MGDLNLARSLYTVGCFLAFVLILLYAYSRKNKRAYDDEARRIIEDKDTPKQ